tara:strand:+ start:19688 stop:21211 length:1524 start_codon:yes stop_codon:yes gene_type:complete
MSEQLDHVTFSPDIDAFRNIYAAGKSQIVWHWMSSDLETPVSTYLKICGHSPYAFLLESVEGGATLGRYSIIGTQPDLLWRCSKGAVEVSDANGQWVKQDVDARESLSAIISQSSVDVTPDDLPPMCALGMFGYIGYDMIRIVEDIPDNNPDDLGVPDSVLMRPSLLVIFDNVKNTMCFATPVYSHANNSDISAEAAYNAAHGRLDKALRAVHAPLDRALVECKTALSGDQAPISNTPEADYKDAVRKAVDYIVSGEIFQVVPSQRFSVDFDLPSFELYRSLRSVNPSPFLFHLAFDGFALVGSSPEILVRVRDDVVTIRPIAGTRRRGATSAEDKALAEELLSDPKERSEHLMLLDLGRNDVGRVAKIGSVNVTEEFQVELYSHVMHIVSNVEGHLRDDVDIVDALFAGFPAGTVSGAPKIRAMEIIDELEVSRRGTYAGGVGYFSKHAMDSCIALRTALVKDNKVYVQAGGGVVADSDPDFEHQECCNKAKAVLHAANLTIQKFT